MAVGLSHPEELPAVEGLRLSTTSAGIYKKSRPDIVLIGLSEDARCSAVFTKNTFAAAPVVIAKEHITQSNIRYCLINAGNANAGTGKAGLEAASSICSELARLTHCSIKNILPFSTGVIGEPLPIDKIFRSLPVLFEKQGNGTWLDAARAIMTTDTVPKAISKKVTLENTEITINGIAKGAGMIRPDMATMLAFIGTDAKVEGRVLDQLLATAVEQTFNRICVDGDTSTNDACVLMASGKASNKVVTTIKSKSYGILRDAVVEVCSKLAQSIVRDGEGASKFITIEVHGGKTGKECLHVGYAVATSPLVKTAFYASDPNWGRILAAVGRSGINNLNIDNISLYLNDVLVVEQGGRSPGYSEEAGCAVMKNDEITVRIFLNRGDCTETLWTCDLSHEYVRINAEYRT